MDLLMLRGDYEDEADLRYEDQTEELVASIEEMTEIDLLRLGKGDGVL
jgi:hypothetical protein